MRMDLERNSELRRHGWRVFRSASRDKLIPSSAVGRVLQRVKIAQAYPVEGVEEGASVSLESRLALQNARSVSAAAAERQASDRPLGVSQYMAYTITTQTGNPDPVNAANEEFVVGLAPFDGFITEAFLELQGGAVAQGMAFRTSGGQTMFTTRDFSAFAPGAPGAEPDMLPVIDLNFNPGVVTLRNLKVPVFSGEQVILVAKLGPAFGVGLQIGAGILGFESFILARPGSAAELSMFGALTVEARRGAREAISNDVKLKIEQERTRREMEKQQGMTARAQIEAAPRAPAGSFQGNPTQPFEFSASAMRALQSRSAPPPPPPRVPPPPKEPAPGEGLTFVSAWNPSFGSIGYLIPDPPRGGRVNVFDNRYTVWDITGKQVDQGAIIPVPSSGDIPAGARLSAVARGTLSAALAADRVQAAF
jgi:hypothetical protein